MTASIADRFRASVDRNGPVHPTLGTPCWIWTGYKTPKGYGQIGREGGRAITGSATLRVHRYSLEQAMGMFGSWLQPFQVDHRCHNKACVNPQHLRPATNKQNHENLPGAQRNSQSGVRGIYYRKDKKRWIARMEHNGEKIHVGSFVGPPPPAAPPPEAVTAVIAKRLELYTHNDLDRVLAGQL